MNEFELIANLLAYPKQIQNIDVKAEWFGTDSYREIVQGVIDTNGESNRMIDICDACNEKRSLLEKMRPEDLDILKNSNNKSGNYFQLMTPFLHKDHLKREIKRYVGLYSDDPKQEYLNMIAEYKAELDAIGAVKDNGALADEYEYLVKLMDGEVNPHFVKTFAQFDAFFSGGLQDDRLYILAARPSVGKSAMAMNIALRAIERNDAMRIDFFSLEASKRQNVFRMLANMTGTQSKYIANPYGLTDDRKKEILGTMKVLMANDIRVYNESYKQKNDIVQKIRERSEGSENYLAIVDYAGLVKVADSRKDERRALNEVTGDLKLLCNELHIPILLLSQVKRQSMGNKKPGLADLKESGSLEQDADAVIIMYREDEEDTSSVNVEIPKNRDGQIGSLKFEFHPEFTKFE